MKTTLQCLVLAASLLFAQHAFSQDRRPCTTSSMVEEELLRNPQVAKNIEELDRFTKEYEKQNRRSVVSDTSILYTIPVVFHIIHNYGPENVSDSVIHALMKMLNEDYQKRNSDTSQVVKPFKKIIGNCQTRFRLARLDPQGNCTSGITRTVSPLTYSAGDQNVKPLISWNTNTQKYLQVWVVQTIASGAAGYSAYPGVFPENVEGVMIRSDYLNIPDLTHEIGHYFNLQHPWGNSNNPGTNCGYDQVNDTPTTMGHASCDLYTLSCTLQGQNGDTIVNYNGAPIENVQNFMDYSYCFNMFTRGQVARMHAAMNSSVGTRSTLWNPSNLIATGTNDGFTGGPCTPIADLAPAINAVCEGSSVTFKNISYGADTMNYSWSFPGGTPNSSNAKNPTITYNTAGNYDVTLTVTNTKGSSNSKTITGFVNVYSSSQAVAPYQEGFESMTFPNSDWLLYNPDATKTWAITSNAGYISAKSMKLDNFSDSIGTVNSFVTANYNLSVVTNPKLSFMISDARKSATSNDQLKIYASSNCGSTWQLRYSKSGTALATVPNPQYSAFTPTANVHWRKDSLINLVGYANKPEVRFKFELTNGRGNNLYIDNINLSGLVGIEEDIAATTDFNIYPNPSLDAANITFNLTKADKVSLKVYDIIGREVKTLADQKMGAGEFRFVLNGNQLDKGTYFVKLMIGDQYLVKKLVFIN